MGQSEGEDSGRRTSLIAHLRIFLAGVPSPTLVDRGLDAGVTGQRGVSSVGTLAPEDLSGFCDSGERGYIGHSAGRADRDVPMRLLLWIAIATVAIATVRSYCDYISSVGFFLVGNRAVLRIRNRVFRHLLQLPLTFHHRARTGDQVIRVTRDVSLLRDVTATAVLPMTASLFVLGGMLFVMFWLQAGLAVLSLITVPLFWISTVRLGRKIRETTRRQCAREGAMATTAAESVGSIAAVKALGLEEKFAGDFSQRNAESQRDDLKANRYSVRLGRTIDILLALSTAIVLYVGGRMVLQSEISAGDLIVFLYYLKRSFKPSQDFAKYTARLAKATAAGECVIDLLERQPDIVDLPTAEPLPPVSPPAAICFDRVGFAYDKRHPVLRDLSFTAPAARVTALVGPSGR